MRDWYLLPDDLVDSFSVAKLSVSHINLKLSQADCWIDGAHGHFVSDFLIQQDMVRLCTYLFYLGQFLMLLVVAFKVYPKFAMARSASTYKIKPDLQ